MSSATDSPPDPVLPERYQIERELGRGGAAIVYLAADTHHGRRVAVKVLRPEFAVTVGADRFRREIDIAAQLSHPHIVPLIDSGKSEGLLYFVSPYIPGGSLQQRLTAEGRLPVDEALQIAEDVGSGLDYVHRSGFVHRDVKPANILVRRWSRSVGGFWRGADVPEARGQCAHRRWPGDRHAGVHEPGASERGAGAGESHGHL